MNKEDKFKPNDIIVLNSKYEAIRKMIRGNHNMEGIILAHTISGGLKIYVNNSVEYLSKKFLEETNYDCIKLKYEEEKIDMDNKLNCKELLSMWIKLNEDNNNAKRKEEIEKIYEKDEVAIDLKDRLQKIDDILSEFQAIYPDLNSHFTLSGTDEKDVITDDSKEEIRKINEKYDIINKEFKKTANEVVAATSICESEESLRNVLKSYGIIDKNGKIKIK